MITYLCHYCGSKFDKIPQESICPHCGDQLEAVFVEGAEERNSDVFGYNYRESGHRNKVRGGGMREE